MATNESFDAKVIERPDPTLLTYYLIVSLVAGPLCFIAAIPLWIRYSTLRYKFDDEGISMCWGILFRREIYLTYKRIQDIHLTRNIVQRWMNLATISVQTASGKSEAEMTIEGILQPEQLRDFLYSKMRGAKEPTALHDPATHSNQLQPASDLTADRATLALLDIRDSLQKLVDQKLQSNR
jgi:uncharacterized protein